ncbi:hypothetical protein Tco_1554314 [Tanacetum coccineum]
MKECGECDASLMKCLLKKNDTSSYHVKLGTNRVLWQNVNGVKRSRMMSAEITSLGKEFGKIEKYLHFSVCSGTETEEGPWLELQFSLADNSKLNIVYLLNRSCHISFTSRRFTRREKDCFMPKGIKQSPLEKVLLKSAEKYIRFSSKDCTWGGQLNAAPVLEVENFTNWKKRFMCHIIGIERQFENIIKNGPFVPMTAGKRKSENQWTRDERKAANLDQRLKSLIMSVLPDDQMNSVINCLTAKSIWDDLILYHEGPSDMKESRVMDLKLCYNTFKFKEGESLTQTFTRYKALMNELVNDGIKLSKLEINTGFINGLPKKWLNYTYKTVPEDIRKQWDAEAEVVQIILTWIENDIYFTVDACPNTCEMWKVIERLKQGELINVQDLETNLYWEFGKFTSRDGESLESYYSRFYKMMNELVKNQCNVTNHQVNVQLLLQLQPECQRFVTLVKQSQELKTVSYHKLYEILKQHQNKINVLGSVPEPFSLSEDLNIKSPKLLKLKLI